MVRRWNTSGECVFSDATIAASADLNDTITAGPPIGSIVAWFPNITGTPQNLPGGWVECNGQLLSDVDSPLNGQVMPDLNTNNKFIRGSSTSNTGGGSATMSLLHGHTTITGGVGVEAGLDHYSISQLSFGSSLSATTSTLPKYAFTIYVIRVK